MKKRHYWLILVIIAYGLIELFSYGGLFLLVKLRRINYEPVDVLSNRHADIIDRFIREETNYVLFSSTLGWSIKENGTSRLYQSNSSGIRSDKEYALHPPRGILRVSTFGDSFTHCSDVKNGETWQAFMESYDSNLEVINFGVGSYGLDQAYLRYLEDGRQYRSHIVLIGFMSENIYRNVNTFRPFYFSNAGIPLAKPRFEIKSEKLSLIPNPLYRLDDYKMLLLYPQEVLSKLGVNDYYYQKRYKSNMLDWSPTVRLIRILLYKVSHKLSQQTIVINGRYNENSEAFIVTKKIFDEFYETAINNRSVPIILIFPNKVDIIQYLRQKEKRYSPLLSYFNTRGYKHIDLMDAFENTDIKASFVGYHYSPLANMLVAKHVHNYLKKLGVSSRVRQRRH